MMDVKLRFNPILKKAISIFLIILITFTMFIEVFNCTNIGVTAQSINLINNPTVDTDVTGWDTNGSYNSVKGEDSTGCIKLTAWQNAYQAVTLEANKTYTYGFYMNGNGITAKLFFQTLFPWYSGGMDNPAWSCSNAGEQYVSQTITTTEAGNYYFCFYVTSGEAYFDSFYIYEGTEIPDPKKPVNSSFNTDTDGWEGNLIYTIDGGENGSGAIKHSESWGGFYKSGGVTLKADTTYEFSFYVGGEGGSAKLYIQRENPWIDTEDYVWGSAYTIKGWVHGEFTTSESGNYWFFMRECGGQNFVSFDSFTLRVAEENVSQESLNLIANPDLDSDKSGWSGDFTYSSSGGQDDTGCLTSASWAAAYQYVTLKSNTEYTFGFYVSGTNAKVKLYIQIENPWNSSTPLWENLNITSTSYVTQSFTTTDAGNYWFFLREWGGDSPAKYDSFFLIEGTDTSVLPSKFDPPQVTDYCTKESFLSNNSNNMIENADFESVPQSGNSWNIEGFSDNASFSIDTAEKYGGNRSLKFTGYNDESEISLKFTAEPLTEYTFGAWVKGGYLSEKYSGNIYFGVVDDKGNFAKFSDDANTHTSNESYSTCFARDMRWHRVGFKFKTAEANEVTFVIRGKNAVMWFDDIVLSKSTNCKEKTSTSLTAPKGAAFQYITNPSCNDADNLIKNITASNAEYWNDSNICRSAVRVGKDPRNNSNEVLIYEPSEYNTSNSYYSRTITVKKNTDYVFSAFYRSDVGANATFGLYYRTDSSSKVLYSVSNSNVGSWKFAKYKFNTKDYDEITFFIKDAGGNLVLDDVRLFEASKGVSLNSDSKIKEMNSPLSSLVTSAPSSTVSNYASKQNYNVEAFGADSAELTAKLEATTDYVWSFNVSDSNGEADMRFTAGGVTAYYGKASNGAKSGLLKTGKTAPQGTFIEFFALDSGVYNVSDLKLTKLAKGDIDCNTNIADSLDMVYLRKILLGVVEIRSEYSTDLNSDSKINIIDLVRLKKNSSE